MKILLDLLRHTYPLIISSENISDYLTQKEQTNYIKKGILKEAQPASSIVCNSCDHIHSVQVIDAERAKYFCPDGGIIYIVSTQLRRVQFDIEIFLRDITKALGIIPDDLQMMEKDKVWKVGTYPYKKASCTIYFIRTDFDQSIQAIQSRFLPDAYQIVLHLDPLQQLVSSHRVHVYLPQLLELKKDVSGWSKNALDRALSQQLRIVTYKENGDLYVHGEKIASIPLGSPAYFFMQYLWTHFDQYVSYSEIFEYCKNSLLHIRHDKKWISEYNENNFCHKRKNEVVRAALSKDHKKIIESLFQKGTTAKGQRAYRLTNPT